MTPSPPATQARIDTALFSASRIRERVDEIAAGIATDFGDDCRIVAILKGSFVFVADLIRQLSERNVHPVVDFISLSSYGAGTESCGTATVRGELSLSVKGRRVLLIDDILDTGVTLQTARQLLLDNGAADVRTCVLLDKPARRVVPIKADYVGFTIDDVFVVGYGLDHDNRYRHLPYLATLSLTAP